MTNQNVAEAVQNDVVEPVAAPAVPKRTLGDIVAEMRRILHEVDEAGGELSGTLEAELTACDADLTQKVDRCLWVADEAYATADVFQRRADDLAQRAKSAKAKGDRLKAYVAAALLDARIDKLPTPNYPGVRLQKNNPSVEIENEDAFVAAHQKDGLVKFEPKIDRKATLDLLKAGQAVVGAKIAPERKHLRY